MNDARPVPTIANAPWLRARATQRVFAALNRNGHVARAVGGCVRNSLFAEIGEKTHAGAPVTDIDFATTATPDETLALAAEAGLRTVPTGLKHGTVTVIADEQGFEVTTLRHDVATDGRHAEVAFTDDWALDAARRDFTMNALYADADGTIFDPLSGFDDLCRRRIRFVGEAGARIREDYLRILRFFRFFAQYGSGHPDPVGLAACVAGRGGLRRLSAERVHQELMKLLVAPGAVATLDIMAVHGLLGEILPVVPKLGRFARLAAHDHPPDAALRLAALTVDVAEDALHLSNSLRLSRREARVLDLVVQVQLTDYHTALDEAAARRLLYRLHDEDYVRWMKFLRALAPSAMRPGDWQNMLKLSERWQAPAFPVTGRQLIALGAAPGPQLGDILQVLEARWLKSDFSVDRESLISEAKILIAETGLEPKS